MASPPGSANKRFLVHAYFAEPVGATVTPLPGSVAMMGAALAGMGYIAYRRNKKTT